MIRYGVFVWDADGDMGDGVLVGPFRTGAAADLKAEGIRRSAERAQVDEYMQAMVVRVLPGSRSNRAVIEAVGDV